MLPTASAMPSIRPTVATLVPSETVRNSGSRAWMLSDDASINRLTRPRAHTVRGKTAVLSWAMACRLAAIARNRKGLRPFSARMATRPPKLVHVEDGQPGITRKKSGRALGLFRSGRQADHRSRRDRPAEQDRAAAGLYRCVVLPRSRAATSSPPGFDDKGRKQYRYHPDYRTTQEAEKFDGCAGVRPALPKLRKRVEADLAERDAEPRAGDRQRGAAARPRHRARRERELRQGQQQLRRDDAARCATSACRARR